MQVLKFVYNGVNGNHNGINGNHNGVNGNHNGVNGNHNGVNGNIFISLIFGFTFELFVNPPS